MTKVSEKIWNERMANLRERRTKQTISSPIKGVSEYYTHIRKASMIGKTVLDVGCGSCEIAKHLPDGTLYVGIDAFPISENVLNMQIENCTFDDNQFETVYAFAMLDNVHDLEKTLQQIKRVAFKNVLFLTGVNIEPDMYHTVKITESLLIDNMKPFKVGYMEYLHPQIMLIEFIK
jgi:ubiquinone/menaquinone biosynthesis C-methylase UbiE